MSCTPFLKILLVEDEPSILLVLRSVLSEAGHKVEAVGDGATALAALSSTSFDLMISDIDLPGRSGLELFRYVREHAPASDTILMTGGCSLELRVQLLKQGAWDCLHKPFELEELLIRVAHIAEHRWMRHLLVGSATRSACPEGACWLAGHRASSGRAPAAS